MNNLRIAVAMTAFNRRDDTLACLRTLQASASLAPGVSLDVCLTDDASTDGTAEAVEKEFPSTHIVRGSGALFWNGGMRRAMEQAIALEPDYFLWLNDDVQLIPDAVGVLIRTAQSEARGHANEPIVVGSTRNPNTGAATYGGRVRRHRLQPLRFSLVEPGTRPLPCETMNANCVLIPAVIVARIGNLDPAFVHGMGDFDYGLRAGRAGYELVVCPGYVGQCTGGSDRGDTRKSFGSMRIAWKSITGPKAFPPAAWRTFTRRYAGPFWILYWLKPYVSALCWGLLRGGI